jgi:hypothetical protein
MTRPVAFTSIASWMLSRLSSNVVGSFTHVSIAMKKRLGMNRKPGQKVNGMKRLFSVAGVNQHFLYLHT